LAFSNLLNSADYHLPKYGGADIDIANEKVMPVSYTTEPSLASIGEAQLSMGLAVEKISSIGKYDTEDFPPSSRGSGTDTEAARETDKAWKPQYREWLIMITLSVISLMVALDATILVTVLPVRMTFAKTSKGKESQS
jgi:hypothetical protein